MPRQQVEKPAAGAAISRRQVADLDNALAHDARTGKLANAQFNRVVEIILEKQPLLACIAHAHGRENFALLIEQGQQLRHELADTRAVYFEKSTRDKGFYRRPPRMTSVDQAGHQEC